MKEIIKIWNDTTKINGKFVAKDVKGMIAFFMGLLFLIVSAVASFYKISVSMEIGFGLLAYSLGNQAFKSHYLVKAAEVINNCNSEETKAIEEKP